MKKLIKTLLCGIFALGFTALIGAYSLKAEDNTLIADLDGDGTEDIIYYEQSVKYVDEDTMDYTFDISINGEKAWSEGRLIELHPDNPSANRLHDELWLLGDIRVRIVDVNPKNSTKEIIASYYASEDNMLLGIKIFRLKKGKLNAICEDYEIPSSSYIPTAQKNNNYLTISTSIWTSTFGCIWVNIDYRITKNGLLIKPSKSGLYTIAPDFYEEGKPQKFMAARNIKVYSDSTLKESKGKIKKNAKFTLKKAKLDWDNPYGNYVVYIKASGLKGWIKVNAETDENNNPIDPLVTNPVFFS